MVAELEVTRQAGYALGRWDVAPEFPITLGQDRVFVESSCLYSVRLNAAGFSDRRVIADGGFPGDDDVFIKIDDNTTLIVDTWPGGYVNYSLKAGIVHPDDEWHSISGTYWGIDRLGLTPTTIFDPTHLPADWQPRLAFNNTRPWMAWASAWRKTPSSDTIYLLTVIEDGYNGNQTFVLRFRIDADGRTIIPDLDWMLPLNTFRSTNGGNQTSFHFPAPVDDGHFAVFYSDTIYVQTEPRIRVYDYSGNVTYESEPLYTNSFSNITWTGVDGWPNLYRCRNRDIVVTVTETLYRDSTGAGQGYMGHDRETNLSLKRYRWNGSTLVEVASRQVITSRAPDDGYVLHMQEFGGDRFLYAYDVPGDSPVGYWEPQRIDRRLTFEILDANLQPTHRYVAPTAQYSEDLVNNEGYASHFTRNHRYALYPVVTEEGNGYFGWVYDDWDPPNPTWDHRVSLFTFSVDGTGTETDPVEFSAPVRLPFDDLITDDTRDVQVVGDGNPWNDDSDDTYVSWPDAEGESYGSVGAVTRLPAEVNWWDITRVDFTVRARTGRPPGRSYNGSYYFAIGTEEDSWQMDEEAKTVCPGGGEIVEYKLTLTEENMRDLDSGGYYVPRRLEPRSERWDGPMSDSFRAIYSFQMLCQWLATGFRVDVQADDADYLHVMKVAVDVYLPGGPAIDGGLKEIRRRFLGP